jgi:hypothetical protein
VIGAPIPLLDARVDAMGVAEFVHQLRSSSPVVSTTNV